MGKLQFCRICRTERNLKYTAKELRQFNKNQLLSAQGSQEGQGTDRASKKLLLTTRTLGNICVVCDERIQIYHHLDDGENDSGSDIEIDVLDTTNTALPTRLVNNLPNGVAPIQRQRPDTPVIVDDDDMLYNLFMQKVDQQRQFKTHQHDKQSLPPQYPLQVQQQQQQTQQFAAQFQSPYTPPQSMAGGSEGDETKIVEVLTSRESTPASSIRLTGSNPMVDQQGHRIVAIIDLDDDNDTKTNDAISRSSMEKETGLLTPLTNSSCDLSLIETSEQRTQLLTSIKETPLMRMTQDTVLLEDDDDEIIFRKVDEAKRTPPSSSKKKNRKSYDEKQLRLVASLSLVSSDSENEETSSKLTNKKSLNTTSAANGTVAIQKRFYCKICNTHFPDAESLSVHDRIHRGVKCPVCEYGFAQIQRLIYHMRYKHREYNGEVLSEKPRISQDSCMTIRLRYMQHTTFYECQLCGRIDEIFREHKEHIIDKHSIESKSLKDPMMKQLKCPLCKEKCGALYLTLCRHLIANHDRAQYKGHLRELVHVSAFGWNAARQEEVAKTARIYQFIKRKTFFFECKICHKVVAGYIHHLKHLNKHKTTKNQKIKLKSNASIKTSFSSSTSTATASTSPITNIILKKQLKNVESIKVIAKNKKIKDKSIATLKTTARKSQILQMKKIQNADTQNKTKYLKRKCTEITLKKLSKKSTTETVTVKKVSKLKSTEESLTKLKIKINLKPKDKATKTTKATKGRPKKKQNEILPKKLTKVKKIRQIDLRKFKCKYCLKKFKGFHLFNLHLLKQHKENEFQSCKKCNEIFATSVLVEQHLKNCLLNISTNKQKRKYIEISSEPTAKISRMETTLEVPNNIETNSQNEEDQHNHQWLNDLLKLNASSKLSDSISSSVFSSMHVTNTNTALFIPQKIILQCCYCLHLFKNHCDLEEHTKQQHSQTQQILIKYKPFNG